MCFVRGLKFEVVVAKTMHAELSSNTWEGRRVDPLMLSWGVVLGKEMKLCASVQKKLTEWDEFTSC
jgi:hypothetical protein